VVMLLILGPGSSSGQGTSPDLLPLHRDGGVSQTVRAALCFRVDTTTVSALTIRGSELPGAPPNRCGPCAGTWSKVLGFPGAAEAHSDAPSSFSRTCRIQ
jgi:hypothetical protein